MAIGGFDNINFTIEDLCINGVPAEQFATLGVPIMPIIGRTDAIITTEDALTADEAYEHRLADKPYAWNGKQWRVLEVLRHCRYGAISFSIELREIAPMPTLKGGDMQWRQVLGEHGPECIMPLPLGVAAEAAEKGEPVTIKFGPDVRMPKSEEFLDDLERYKRAGLSPELVGARGRCAMPVMGTREEWVKIEGEQPLGGGDIVVSVAEGRVTARWRQPPRALTPEDEGVHRAIAAMHAGERSKRANT